MTEPTTASEGMLSRIRGLLAKAESTEFPAEAEALTAKATELIAKYGIDQALLKTDDGAPVVPGDRKIFVPSPYAIDKLGLLVTIAHRLRCRTVRWSVAGGQDVHLFGFAADLDRVELLYTSLLVQQANAMNVAVHAKPWSEDTKAWKRSFMSGYANAIGDRLFLAERRAAQGAQADRGTQSGPSVALVLVDRKDQVDRAIEDAYPDLRKGRRRQLSGSGARDGRAAGYRANLGGTGISSGSGRVLSR